MTFCIEPDPACAPNAPVSTASRQAALPGPLQAMHRAVLREFLVAGRPPSLGWLGDQAKSLGLGRDEAIAGLADADLVHVADGAVTVAYPFSGVPTVHRVRLDTGVEVYAMCAVDALGIPLMSGHDVIIHSVDALTGAAVCVEAKDGQWRWDPPDAVVLVGRVVRANGPISSCRCPHMNFHTHPDNAAGYLKAHPELAGDVLDQAAAIQTGGRLFGPLLSGSIA